MSNYQRITLFLIVSLGIICSITTGVFYVVAVCSEGGASLASCSVLVNAAYNLIPIATVIIIAAERVVTAAMRIASISAFWADVRMGVGAP